MPPFLKTYGTILIAIVTVTLTLATALFGKDTPYENAWLYITSFGIAFMAIFEAYTKRK